MRVVYRRRLAHLVPIALLLGLHFRYCRNRVPFFESQHFWRMRRGCDFFCQWDAAWFDSMLQAEPNQRFTEQEVRQYHDRGVVLFRGAIQNRDLFERLYSFQLDVARLAQGTIDHNRCDQWNPAVRALRDHLQRVATSAIPGIKSSKDLRCRDSPAFQAQGVDGAEDEKGYHFDLARPYNVWPSYNAAQITFHIAMTDSSAPLKFVLDSSKARGDIDRTCGKWYKCTECDEGVGLTYKVIPQECVSELSQSMSRPDVNLSIWAPDVEAGDILVFDGNVLHLTIERHGRLSQAIRFQTPHYLPDAMTDVLMPEDWVPPGVVPIPD